MQQEWPSVFSLNLVFADAVFKIKTTFFFYQQTFVHKVTRKPHFPTFLTFSPTLTKWIDKCNARIFWLSVLVQLYLLCVLDQSGTKQDAPHKLPTKRNLSVSMDPQSPGAAAHMTVCEDGVVPLQGTPEHVQNANATLDPNTTFEIVDNDDRSNQCNRFTWQEQQSLSTHKVWELLRSKPASATFQVECKQEVSNVFKTVWKNGLKLLLCSF